ncbi:hypothetical protein SPRG_13806 [Saprolegnia parasitica CBS 223.65]|uniref:DUF676 domain-containing protein n=1 Tax=Saprolegnia parasitica (strain CBS 223.65) TaxID=695850 RepID=A0A067C2S6_SAPPC|nr:hypothetical protein SPRG_13806 [Saprolegnia parasitica CBS 223.65]KDO21097.1 hypothetical protein SPRG_13806 [Saprolegnia parasitica CBS 223.65]|eukprot:XP_012208192.1 hypothetical protein SPRG_13806 [Saprolegnia parasitica CBS 223.65]
MADDDAFLFGAPPATNDRSSVAPGSLEYEDLFGAPPAPASPATSTGDDASNLFGPPPRDAAATHLVVLQHGLHGSPSDYHTFGFILRDVFRDEPGLYIVAATSNAKDTHDGIDAGGLRLADEVQSLAATCPRLEKVSLIGHSLGGLYVRYCIGVLYARGFFEQITPMNVITLATPHLGVRAPFNNRGAVNAVVNTISSKLFDRTGAQFVLQDTASPTCVALATYAVPLPMAPMAGTLEIQLPAPNVGYALLAYRLLDGRLNILLDPTDTDPIFSFSLDGMTALLFVPEPRPTTTDAETEASSYLYDDDAIETAIARDTVLQLHNTDHSLSIEVRMATSVDWALLHAVVRYLGRLRCVNYVGDKNVVRASLVRVASAPSLLQCLSQGAFLFGLGCFRRRALYSNIFFDIQVPFAVGSIRSFNPYQNNATSCATSPLYPHVTLHSLANAPLLRDTLPPQRWTDMDVYPVQSPTPKGRFDGWGNLGQYLFQANKSTPSTPSATGSNGTGPLSPSPNLLSPSALLAGRHVTVVSKDTAHVLVDSPEDAFVHDPLRDILRGMLVSLQALPYERADVLFDGVLGHERIIAKRHTAFTPCESGVDVVHHVADTFLL